MTRDVTVRDVGPRDGLQLVKTVVPTQVKLDWIAADREAGLPEVEVCSFVPAGRPGVPSGTRSISGTRVTARQAVNFCQCCFSPKCQP